ncbi:DUF397 domain-containing protein [Amycolatopsis sp. CA-230715]|uniref:DUF397 domain-containing protein n=1 Tax=Amycolatopsis sp. CA-230715 TaxID=2745196 RepID=UPI001C02F56F|nr:DUF397 domain-containing protein [Amycolatopsis sp. CA-230715]QWF83220.1 hypothetical protein HUW46_06660 [Amycolatopsis sp. CA-230715]
MTVSQDLGGWFKSSWSPEKANCVEVRLSPTVGVRDTKDRDSGHLDLAPTAWGAFLAQLDS